MNILFVTHAPPLAPLDGASLIVHHLARELAAQHTLYLCTLYAGEKPNETRLQGYFADVRLAPMPTRSRSLKWAESLSDATPLWVRAYAVPALREALREMLDRYPMDVVHCDTGLMAQYVDVLERVPRLVAPHDSLTRVLEQNAQTASRSLERMTARLQVDKMRNYETSIYRRFARVVVVSARERDYLQSLAPALKVSVIPNGVNTDDFAPLPAPITPNSLGFLGAMDYAPNRDAALYFVREILPRVHRTIPDASFTVIGRNPTSDVRALAADPQIRVTGTVDDVRPYLAAQSVMVFPMRTSGGIKNKVLEALAMGKAVVATPEAADGLEVQDGMELVLEKDAESFAAACVRLLRDRRERERLGGAARAWALQHTWGKTAHEYLAVYQRVTDAAEHAAAVG